jgi:hypothetical protein
MEKRNEVKAGVTACDKCTSKSSVITSKGALCREHAKRPKEGAAGASLKSAGEELADSHNV